MSRIVKKQYGQLWMQCLLCLCLLPRISSEYLTFSQCGELPDDDIFVCPSSLHTRACKESLTTLCCEIHENGTADDITISIGEHILETEKIGDTIRKATVNLTEVGSYTYTCNTRSKRPKIKIVNVIKPPSKVTDFKCRSDNLEILNCTWSRPNKDYNYTKYEIHDFLNGTPRKNAKIQHSMGENTAYAVWTESSHPQYRNEEATLTFHLKSFNPLGEINETISLNHHSFVKPKPVLKLAAINITSRTATLQWQLDAKMMLIEGVIFRIEITSPVNNQNITKYDSYTIQKEQFIKKKNTFKLSSLIAYSKYTVRVYVKPWIASSEFWSEPSKITFLTESEKPERPPIIPAGAFSRGYNNNQRIVDIYWKLIEDYEKAGANFEYTVNVKESPGVSKYSTKTGSLELRNKSLDAIEILVSSNNEVGSSNWSSLYVPAVADSKLNVNSFTVLSYANGTYDMMWLNKDNVDNYTVFWCKYDITFCKNGIEFVNVDGKRQELRIELPQPDLLYQFAIAANKGQMSSGIQMNKECDNFSEDSLAKSNFPVTIHAENYTDSRVDLVWSLKCLYKKGIITGYNITYSYVNLNGECSYNKSIPSSIYISDPATNKISITNLHPYTEYKFEVGVDTKFRAKAGTASTNIITKQGTPAKPEILNITEVTNNSVTINLKPLLRLNGPIKNVRFIVYNYTTEVYNNAPKCTCNKCDIYVKNLSSFTVHRLSVKSYNEEINSYSDATNTTLVKTKMGRPDKITAWYSSSNSTLTWDRPELRGVLDHYEVKIKLNCDSCNDENIFETNETYFTDVVTGCKPRTYYVRAVNKDEAGVLYPGDWGSGSNFSCEINFVFIVYIVLGAILVLVLVCLGYKHVVALKLRMKVDPPKFHPSLDINMYKNDRALGSFSTLENCGLVGADESRAKVQQNRTKSNKLNYFEEIPFLIKAKTPDFDSKIPENQDEPYIKCKPRTTQPINNSVYDNDSGNDPANIYSHNLLTYQNCLPMDLTTGYVQAYPIHNTRTDESEDNNVSNNLPGWRENLPTGNSREILKQPSISNTLANERALPDVLYSAIDTKTHNLLTNDQSAEPKCSPGYVKALPTISSHFNSKSDKLPTFDASDPDSLEMSSSYVKASPDHHHLHTFNSKSRPLLASISIKDKAVEPGCSKITSGYVKALPMPKENKIFKSAPS